MDWLFEQLAAPCAEYAVRVERDGQVVELELKLSARDILGGQ